MPRSGSRVRVSFPAPNLQTSAPPRFFCPGTPFSRRMALPGWVAEWLCSGLQSRVPRFDSGPSLHLPFVPERGLRGRLPRKENTKRLRTRFLVLFLSALLAAAGCATDEQGRRREMTDTEKGAIIGAATGVLLGLATRREAKYGALYGIVGGIAGGGGRLHGPAEKRLREAARPGTGAGCHVHGEAAIEPVAGGHDCQHRLCRGLHPHCSRLRPRPRQDRPDPQQVRQDPPHIIGHTDSTGSRAYNQKLSERRAEAVKRALLARNVTPERITTAGAGEDHPRASNATPEGRRKNRRVEIIIEPVVEPEG